MTSSFTKLIPRWGIASILLAAGSAGHAEGQHKLRPNTPPRSMFLNLSVQRGRHTRTAGDMWDDRSQDIKMSIELTNRNPTQEFKGLTGYFYVVAQDVVNKKKYKLIIKESESFNLAGGQRVQHESSEVHLDFDDHEPMRYGYKYYGYVYLVEDKNGKVLVGEASTDILWQKLDKLADTNLNEEFGL